MVEIACNTQSYLRDLVYMIYLRQHIYLSCFKAHNPVLGPDSFHEISSIFFTPHRLSTSALPSRKIWNIDRRPPKGKNHKCRVRSNISVKISFAFWAVATPAPDILSHPNSEKHFIIQTLTPLPFCLSLKTKLHFSVLATDDGCIVNTVVFDYRFFPMSKIIMVVSLPLKEKKSKRHPKTL